MKLGIAVPVLVTAHAVNIGAVVSVVQPQPHHPQPPDGGAINALHIAQYNKGFPSQIHPSTSVHSPFDVWIVNILSERHCCHCAKLMRGFPPIHVHPSTSVHKAW